MTLFHTLAGYKTLVQVWMERWFDYATVGIDMNLVQGSGFGVGEFGRRLKYQLRCMILQ
jgi:hypothetical protein